MVWGAFTNSSTAMMALSNGLGTISENIANLNTVGYKDTETLFKTTLSETLNTATGTVSSMGVKGYVRSLVDTQGTITSSDTWSDLAINGEGFFIVSDTFGSTTDLNSYSTYYTRAGDFQTREVDDKAYFTTSSGLYVMGWMADSAGNVDTSGELTPLYIEPDTLLDGAATTSITLNANIPAGADLTQANYTDEFTVTDYDGNEKTISVSWTRIDGDNWEGTFSVEDGSGTIVNDVVDVTLDGNGNVVSPSDSSWDMLFEWGSGWTSETIDLNSLAPQSTSESVSLAVYDQNGDIHTVSMLLEHSGSNEWYLRLQTDDDDGVISNLTAADGTTSSSGYSIPVEFDSEGAIVSPTSLTFTATWNDTEAGVNTVTLDLSQLTQYDSDSSDIIIDSLDQDGYAPGTLVNVEFTTDGELSGQFSNGETRTLFKIPVATFVSPNQLEAVSGTLYRSTPEAGEVTVQAIEDVGGGTEFSPNSLEASTVDLEDQFTRMIITQKAYSTNATVFKTADEMLTAVRDLI